MTKRGEITLVPERKKPDKPKPKEIISEKKKEMKKIAKIVTENKPIQTPTKLQKEKEIIPDIEMVVTTTTRYDVNWYYFKHLFVRFERWLISPYTKYTIWFNKKFNTPKQEEKAPETVKIIWHGKANGSEK